jgi:hypothetical protein
VLLLDGEELLASLDSMVRDRRDNGVASAIQDLDPAFGDERRDMAFDLRLSSARLLVAIESRANARDRELEETGIVGQSPKADICNLRAVRKASHSLVFPKGRPDKSRPH